MSDALDRFVSGHLNYCDESPDGTPCNCGHSEAVFLLASLRLQIAALLASQPAQGEREDEPMKPEERADRIEAMLEKVVGQKVDLEHDAIELCKAIDDLSPSDHLAKVQILASKLRKRIRPRPAPLGDE